MRAFVITSLLLALAACGASLQETQVGVYVAADQACALQAPDYDAGVACVQNNHRVFCGPGGVFADAGICPK